MTKLCRLFDEDGQSPWLDNLTRNYLHDGTLARYVRDGIRGVTANPMIFAKAPTRSTRSPKTPSQHSNNKAPSPGPSISMTLRAVLHQLAGVGIDMDDVGRILEDRGVTSLHDSFAHVLDTLTAKARQ